MGTAGLLRFITCGSVDDGKSTLIGRLLWETRHVLDDQLVALQADSRRHGTQGDAVDLALLVDGLAAEREQGITIDVAYRYFGTARRRFIVADTPGHEQYTRNMVTGASTADAAILLVDARQGLTTQTRRHAYLASLMGVRQVALAVNKMDLVGFDRTVFERLRDDFAAYAQALQCEQAVAIPICALRGDNIAARSPQTAWYTGPTLLAYLETVTPEPAQRDRFVFPVQWVNRPHADFRGLAGTVAHGGVRVGDRIRVTASGQTAAVARIVTMDAELDAAAAGDAVTLVLDEDIDASRGDVLSAAGAPVEASDQFEATIVWMSDEPGLAGRSYRIKLATQWGMASITAIKHRVDVNTLAHEAGRQLQLNEVGVCNIAVDRPLAFDAYEASRVLGGFILVDRYSNATVAAGMIRHSLRRAQNVHRQVLSIGRAGREALSGHRSRIIWLTGLSGSGKSTLANALEVALHAQGKRTYILDGDNIRQGLSKDLGFTDADRVENIRRVAEVAKLMLDAGLIVITAFISPFRQEREMARELIGPDDFLEVHVDTPLAVCEQRDPKGLYRKARAGQLPNMTGLTSPYEPPENPALVCDGTAPLEGVVESLLAAVLR
ncbi:sulfate adenylyltransferase subunit CysN [Caenimonas sedimenti]|uniref:Multifunctional fusion protein n=1 Tax=Caenimonas sedimenti TaxID=2596921 RepID=A0A562ZV53_9BURK|nr:sulfate adenylyltransferase subunit CysN [Caenimonas sedimenti]TWO72479.1 sulfate adenylyltransferase subunit CysN [Caenimonas sedimenti]